MRIREGSSEATSVAQIKVEQRWEWDDTSTKGTYGSEVDFFTSFQLKQEIRHAETCQDMLSQEENYVPKALLANKEEEIARLSKRIEELEKEKEKLASENKANKVRTAKIAWLLSNIIAMVESKWGACGTSRGKAALSFRKHMKGIRLGMESVFFRILATLCRPCFLIILVPMGVKTKDLDISWQKNQLQTV